MARQIPNVVASRYVDTHYANIIYYLDCLRTISLTLILFGFSVSFFPSLTSAELKHFWDMKRGVYCQNPVAGPFYVLDPTTGAFRKHS